MFDAVQSPEIPRSASETVPGSLTETAQLRESQITIIGNFQVPTPKNRIRRCSISRNLPLRPLVAASFASRVCVPVMFDAVQSPEIPRSASETVPGSLTETAQLRESQITIIGNFQVPTPKNRIRRCSISRNLPLRPLSPGGSPSPTDQNSSSSSLYLWMTIIPGGHISMGAIEYLAPTSRTNVASNGPSPMIV